jgi:hypothetical protein
MYILYMVAVFSGAAGFFTPISTPWGSFGRAVYLKVNLQKETE